MPLSQLHIHTFLELSRLPFYGAVLGLLTLALLLAWRAHFLLYLDTHLAAGDSLSVHPLTVRLTLDMLTYAGGGC